MLKEAARALLMSASIGFLNGCGTAVAATAAPAEAGDEREQVEQVDREQTELERRRVQLQQQVLSDLRQLRERRQASTSGAEEPEVVSTEDCELLLFGGVHHEVFLGCLSEEARPDSVFNMVGEHGSDLSPASVRNKFAPYGSNYHDTSACNPAAKHPPLIVTSDGKSLGLLTLNPTLKRRIEAPSLTDWLARMCGV